jgi:CDP-glycerol glycerophosphotransferase
VYAPTYRELHLGGHYYEFSVAEIEKIKALLRTHNAVLGIRMHYFNRQVSYNHLVDNDIIVDLDQSHIPDMAMIIRESHIVITDYSGLFVDALYLKKPAISFAYDRVHYMATQRGFVYDLDVISPLPVCETFDDTMSLVANILFRPDYLPTQEIERAQKIFFEHIDSDNGLRAVLQIAAMVH